MKKNPPMFRIGDIVEVKSVIKTVDEKIEASNYNRFNRIIVSASCVPFTAVITGAGFRNEGIIIYNGSEEGVDFKTLRRIPVWYVRRYVRGKEIAVLEENIKIMHPFCHYGAISTESYTNQRFQPIPINHSPGTLEYIVGKERADIIKSQMRDQAKLQRRGSDGRFMK